MFRCEWIVLFSIVCLLGIGAPRSAFSQATNSGEEQTRQAISSHEREGAHRAAQTLFAAYQSYKPDPALKSFEADLITLRSALAELRHSLLEVTEPSLRPARTARRQEANARVGTRHQEQRQRVRTALSRIRTQATDRRELLQKPPTAERNRAGPKGERPKFSGPRQLALSKVDELAAEVEALLALPADRLETRELLRLENRLRLRPRLVAPEPMDGTPTLRARTRHRGPQPTSGRPRTQGALR